MSAKYIFVTGGVVSSLSKGLAAASIGCLHASVQTTERYLGCKQRIRSAVNDRIGIEPNP